MPALRPPILSLAEPSIVGEVLIFEMYGRGHLAFVIPPLSVSGYSHVSSYLSTCMISIFGFLLCLCHTALHLFLDSSGGRE